MFMNRIVLLALAGALFAGRARADEMDFLPDGTGAFLSGKFQDYLKSKVSVEFKRMLGEIAPKGAPEQDFEKEISNELGIPVANIARISMAVTFEKSGGDREIGMVSTIKPVTAASIIEARKKRSSFRQNVTFKEVKVGKYTVHEESYQFEQFDDKDKNKDKKLSERQRGEAFCIVEENLVLFGRLITFAPPGEKAPESQFRRALERNGKPMLSANMKAGLANAPMSNSGVMIMDLQASPRQQTLFRDLGLESFKDLAAKLDVLAVTINEKDKVNAKVTLICKDAATATLAKKHTDARLVVVRDTIKKAAAAELPKGQEELRVATEKVLGALTTSVSGNQAIAEVAAPPEQAVRFVFGFVFLAGTNSPPEPKRDK